MSVLELREAFRAGRLTKPEYIKAMTAAHGALYDYAELLKGSQVERLEVTQDGVVVVTRELGLRLLLVPGDARLAQAEMLNFGEYEKALWERAFSLMPEGVRLFDVGANVGAFALSAARRVKSARVHAFEPVPSTFALLEKHLTMNGAVGVRAHPWGLSEKAGTVTFRISDQGSANASAADLGNGPAREVPGVLKTLDAAAREFGDPGFVKCDVEGGELLAFRGGVETLRRAKPVVMTEMLRKWAAGFGYHPNDIIALFAGLGYRCFDSGLEPFAKMDDATTETNFFFLHPDVHAAYIARAGR
ncbi:FkbM family methyltransferase [bacterium]|nr:MAG: FkbM family methyltransferase [bacterium]